ncbi:MAG TPA: ABC transporter substrate-binding protein [Polyangiales bacterium]
MTTAPTRRTFLVTTLLALTLLGLGQATASAEPSARAFLEQRHEQVHAILKRPASSPTEIQQRNARLTEAIGNLLDYTELSKRALSDHWAELSDPQRTDFVSLLSRLVERNYQKNLESTLDFKVRYTGEVGKDDGVVVQTIAHSKANGRAPEIAIDYTLVAKEGAWRVWDVTTDGVSLVSNYRTQFNRIIHKDGFDALIERMRKRLDSGDGAI